MTDYALALQTKPPSVDVATPLLTAARIRAADAEQQKNQFEYRQNVIGSEARGLAALADSPDFPKAWGEAHDRMLQQGAISPEAHAQLRNSPSPLILHQLLASTQTPQMALAEKQFAETQKQHGQTFGLQSAQFEEAKRQHGVGELAPVKIGTGAFGEDIMGVKDVASGGFRRIDPKTGLTVGSDATPSAGISAIPAKDVELDTKAGRNVAFLQSLDPEQQGIVRKMANYEMNPNTLSIKGGHRERVLSAVAQFDPNYDQKNYMAFSEGLKKFQSGKQGDSVRSFNVGIEHIDQLLQLGRALDNGDIPKLNELRNWVKTNLGQDAPTNFNGLKAIVGAEIVKAIVGAGGGQEERATAARTVSGASSIAQLEGIAKTYSTAMGAQLGGLQRQYEQSTGRKDFDRLLSPQAIRSRDNHQTKVEYDDSAIVDARKALATGKLNRAEVEKRLRGAGIAFKPSDLDLQ